MWYASVVVVHVIGLTGGIASGKSTVGRLLAARGAAIVDADQLAREIVEPGKRALAELVARFGPAILTAEGKLDRKRLGAIAFADPAARKDLGAITHPRIAEASARAIAAWGDLGANVVFYEAALLVENKAYQHLAGLIVVSVTPELQEARIQTRDALSAADARARIAAQAPLADKLAAATWVIENRAGLPELEREVDTVVADVERRFGPIAVPAPRRPDPTRARAPHTTLLTGFPAFTARRMIAHLAAREPETTLYVLARQKFAEDARRFLAALPARPGKTEVLVGDVCDMDLGLSSAEYRALAHDVTWIEHMASIYFAGVDRETTRRLNVEGTRAILDLARDARRLERVVHWSTAMVSGKRRGRVYETELDAGQKFHNDHERTKWQAEMLVHAAMRQLPITVIRPGVIVGDSATGEIDKLDGPYYLMVLIATNASGVRLPLLGRGDAPLHLVPIDYVIEAGYHVARTPDAAGKTFHVVDPAPLSAHEIFDQVAELAGTQRPRGSIPRPLARAVLRTPGLSRLGRGPLAFVDLLDHEVFYDSTNTARALAGSPIRCPALADYLPTLVAYVKSLARPPARPSAAELADPLD